VPLTVLRGGATIAGPCRGYLQLKGAVSRYSKDAGSVRNAAWRRPEGSKIVNVSSEDARLAGGGPREITLYTRPGCHLCEEAKALIEPLLGEFRATLREVNIDDDAELTRRYGTDIPVVFIGARKAAKHRVDPVKFRRQLRDAV
jgi:glutaredoxin